MMTKTKTLAELEEQTGLMLVQRGLVLSLFRPKDDGTLELVPVRIPNKPHAEAFLRGVVWGREHATT